MFGDYLNWCLEFYLRMAQVCFSEEVRLLMLRDILESVLC